MPAGEVTAKRLLDDVEGEEVARVVGTNVTGAPRLAQAPRTLSLHLNHPLRLCVPTSLSLLPPPPAHTRRLPPGHPGGAAPDAGAGVGSAARLSRVQFRLLALGGQGMGRLGGWLVFGGAAQPCASTDTASPGACPPDSPSSRDPPTNHTQFTKSAVTHKATKRALSQLTETLAAELAESGVTSVGVHNLSPGGWGCDAVIGEGWLCHLSAVL